ncbi:MAG: trkA2 [Clostridiales bacterium]|nr:trkA2 [Clostridiales bacterium]
MYIVIIGCGRLGSTVAKMLSNEGHDIAIIDNDIDNLDRLGSGFNGHRIRGVEFDNDVLLDGGIDKADVFLALTSDDNTNIMASQIASDIFGVKRVIARVCEPEKEFIYESLGIEIVEPIQLTDEIIRNRIIEEGSKILSVLDNNIEIVELHVRKGNGRTVSSIEKFNNCIISSLFRNGSFILPDKEDEVLDNDKLVCTINRKNRGKLISSLSKEVFV